MIIYLPKYCNITIIMTDRMRNRRLIHEISEIAKNPLENCSAGPNDDDITVWNATIMGPNDSPFEGGIFKLQFNFPYKYPMSPPNIQFITKVYHPNISSSGEICLDILKNQWSPVLSVSKILLSLISLLTDPNPDDPLVMDIANIYNNNNEKYKKTAREWTKKYATENNSSNATKISKYDSDDEIELSSSDDSSY